MEVKNQVRPHYVAQVTRKLISADKYVRCWREIMGTKKCVDLDFFDFFEDLLD